MATLSEVMAYTKDDETVTVPAKLFVDLVEACGWIQGFCADIKIDEVEDPNSLLYLAGEAVAIRQKAEDWIAANWRPIDKGDCEF
jgi:hypothetical protein